MRDLKAGLKEVAADPGEPWIARAVARAWLWLIAIVDRVLGEAHRG